MAWSWIIKLIPLTDEIIDGFRKVRLRDKKKKEMANSVKKSIVNLYSKQFKTMNRDIALIKGWKPIVSKIHAIDIILNRWEYLVDLSVKYKNPKLALEQITKENVVVLLTETSKVEKEMNSLAKEVQLNWDEGGTDLAKAIELLNDKLNDIKNDLGAKISEDKKIERLIIQTRQAQEETIEFFKFWDGFLKELFVSAKEGSKNFVDSLDSEVQKTVKKIQSDYPTTTWSSYLNSILTKLDLNSDSSGGDGKDED